MRYAIIYSSLLSGLACSWSMIFSFRATVIRLLFEKDVEAYIQRLAETLNLAQLNFMRSMRDSDQNVFNLTINQSGY